MLTYKQNIYCENVQHALDFLPLKVVPLLTGFKHKPHFLLIGNKNYSKMGVYFSVDESLCSLQFRSPYPSLHSVLNLILHSQCIHIAPAADCLIKAFNPSLFPATKLAVAIHTQHSLTILCFSLSKNHQPL